MSKNKKTALYRHFCNDGNLLYVGISNRLPRRVREHNKLSHWFEEVCDIKIEWFKTRENAITAEKEAIKAEKPKWNIIHNKMDEVLDDIQDKVLLGEVTVKRDTYIGSKKLMMFQTIRTASDFTGLSMGSIELLVRKGYLPSVLESERYSEYHNRYYYTRFIGIWDVMTLIEDISENGLIGIVNRCQAMKTTHPLKTDNEYNELV